MIIVFLQHVYIGQRIVTASESIIFLVPISSDHSQALSQTQCIHKTARLYQLLAGSRSHLCFALLDPVISLERVESGIVEDNVAGRTQAWNLTRAVQ